MSHLYFHFGIDLVFFRLKDSKYEIIKQVDIEKVKRIHENR